MGTDTCQLGRSSSQETEKEERAEAEKYSPVKLLNILCLTKDISHHLVID